jgi:anti-sigma factor RsiW
MSANHETHGAGRSDLDWLAFQYVAGELSTEDEQQFETRLAAKPEVAEAVARAMTLGETVSLVFAAEFNELAGDSRTVRRHAKVSRESVAGRTVSVLTAACVIAAALLISFRRDEASQRIAHEQTPVTSTETPADVSSLLLQTWTDARESIAALDGDVVTESAATDLSDSRADLAGDVPDWMFVVVELSYRSEPGNPNRNVLEN